MFWFWGNYWLSGLLNSHLGDKFTQDKLNNLQETKCEQLVDSLFKCGCGGDQSGEEKLTHAVKSLRRTKENGASWTTQVTNCNLFWTNLTICSCYVPTLNLIISNFELVHFHLLRAKSCSCYVPTLNLIICSCYVPTCEYTTTPGLSAESQLKDLDMHMKYAHGKHLLLLGHTCIHPYQLEMALTFWTNLVYGGFGGGWNRRISWLGFFEPLN